MDKSFREVSKQGCDALRSAFNNHQRLIVAADIKAHNLIQVNGLIVSVLLALMVEFFSGHQLLLAPVFTQLAVSLVVIVLCLAVTRPKMGWRYGGPADLSMNLLFFACYEEMEEDEYAREMGVMLEDADKLYGGLIRESYHQARVLRKKYKYLRLAHHVFGAGIVLTVLVAVLELCYW